MNFLCTLFLILSTFYYASSYACSPSNTSFKYNANTEAVHSEPTIAVEFKNLTPLNITHYGYAKDYQLMKGGRFRYLGQARTMHELTLDSKGYFVYQGKKLDTYKPWRWVMDFDGRIFVMPPKLHGDSFTDVFHSSIVGDEWPVAGGMLEARSGTVWKITNGSGHFKPEAKRLEAVLAYLIRKKAKIKTDALELIALEDAPQERLNFKTHAAYRENILRDISFEHPEIQLEKRPIISKYVLERYQRFLEGQHQISFADRSLYKITINHKGQLIYQGKPLHNESNELFNWVLHKDGTLYAAPKLNNIDHSSLVEHDWPVAAGELKANNGTLIAINNKSHAFRFDEITLIEVTDYLKSRGVMMNINIVETFFTFVMDHERLQHISVDDFKMKFVQGQYQRSQQNCTIQ